MSSVSDGVESPMMWSEHFLSACVPHIRAAGLKEDDTMIKSRVGVGKTTNSKTVS